MSKKRSKEKTIPEGVNTAPSQDGSGEDGEERIAEEGVRGKGKEKGPYVREKMRWHVIRFLLFFTMLLFLVLGRSAQWVTVEWGDLTLDEVVFTMTQPLKGTDFGIIWSYIRYSLIGPVAITALLLFLYLRFLLAKQPPRPKKTVDEYGNKVRIPPVLSDEEKAVLKIGRASCRERV